MTGIVGNRKKEACGRLIPIPHNIANRRREVTLERIARVHEAQSCDQPARRRRRELVTTMTLEAAMAAPAIIGLSSPAAASGIAATL